MAFAFENLKVYQESLNWVERVNFLEVNPGVKIKKALIDQLNRASLSIPLNIAEGNGRWHKAERRQFFWIARGSVFECAAIMQVMNRVRAVDDDCYAKAHAQLEEISKMLTGLIKSFE